MDWLFASGCSPPRLSADAVAFSYGQPVLCPTGTFTPLLVRTLRRTRRHIFNGLFTGEEVSKWSTTIVVMAAFDSGQLASLRSLINGGFRADVPNTRFSALG